MNSLTKRSSHIMVVDDTPQKLKFSDNMLGEEGYLISAFLDGSMALQAAVKKPPDLVLLDINMPALNGYGQINEMMIPSKGMLVETIHAAIWVFMKLAEVRDDETDQHIERTRLFCRILTEQLRIQCPGNTEINNVFIENIYVASLLHDIGKVAISDEILFKPGKLNAEEFKIMKTHTVIGAKILQTMLEPNADNALLIMAIEISLSHHEQWDGSGYPQNLKGKSIPLSARIMALADVYDALTSKRCYKPAFSHEKSRDIILEGRGTHFDPEVIDAFLVLEDQFRIIKNDLK